MFNPAKVKYEVALKKSGYSVDLKYTNNKSEKVRRKWNIIWLNPLFSKSNSTKIAKTFLKLVTNIFQEATNLIKFPTGRDTIKSKTINGHNKKSLRKHVTKHQNAISEKKQNVQLYRHIQISRKMFPLLIWKTGNSYLSKPEGTLEQDINSSVNGVMPTSSF